MTMLSIVSSGSFFQAQASDRSPKNIALFCSAGLIASICLIASGVNLGAAWL
jgi:hypothetical protein